MLARRKRPSFGLRDTPQIRCQSHLKFVRGFECCIAGREGHECGGKIEAAHVRNGTDGGMGVKPSDSYAVPLCNEHHRLQHVWGETTFWATYKIDPLKLAAELWAKSPHRHKVEA